MKPLDLKNNKRKINNFVLLLKILKPILLSHHPSCKTFENHTFKIGKRKFCIGCFIGFPTAILGIIVIYYSKLVNVLDSKVLLMASMIFLASFILSPLNLTKIKIIKIIQKFLIGLGSTFLFWWIWTLQNLFIINLLYFLVIFCLLLTILTGYHAYGFYATCKKCQYSLNWKICPGFKDFIEYLEKNNLPNIFNKIKNNIK